MIETEKVAALVEEKLVQTDVFLVNLEIQAGNKIFVYLDSDSGVSIETCIQVSRHIESNLDREVEDFALEVSSAGFMPLKLKRQYVKNIGRNLKIQVLSGERMLGKLESVEENGITLEVTKQKQKQMQIIAFDQIKTAVVEVSFK